MSRLVPSGFLTRALVAAAGVVFSASTAGAAVLYDANIPRYFNTQATDPLYYQVQNPSRILFDDVPVNFTGTGPQAIVTRVSFDVTQVANAPGTTVTAYYAPMVADALQFGGNAASDSAAFDDPGTPVSVGSTTLNSTIGFTRTTISFGDGVTPMFTVPLDVAQNPGGPGYFFLGLQFSSTSDRVGWTIADPGAIDGAGLAANGNIDLLFDYASPTNFEEFTYGTDGNGSFIAGAQMMKVEGFVVPEPATAGVAMLVGGVFLMRQRGKSWVVDGRS